MCKWDSCCDSKNGKDLWLVIGAVKDIATVWKPYLFML